MRSLRFGWLVLELIPASALATQVTITPSDAANLSAILNGLQPGDDALLEPGTYSYSNFLALDLVGTADQPILIHAADAGVVLEQTGNLNVLQITDAEYLTIDGLELTGSGIGLKVLAGSWVTVSNCSIHDLGDRGILISNPGAVYTGIQLIHDEVYNTGGSGDGVYLGCNDNACLVTFSTISNNYIHDTNGPNVTPGFGDGIRLLPGSSENDIIDNVIANTGAECILADFSDGGPPNSISRNLVYDCGDNGIQVSRDAYVYNNIILGVANDGIAAQTSVAGGDPQDLEIYNNTIVNPTGTSIVVFNVAGAVTIANNALYSSSGASFAASGRTSDVSFVGDVGTGAVNGLTVSLQTGTLAGDFAGANDTGAPPMDVFPKAGGALPGVGIGKDEAYDDFNGTLRQGSFDVGAYVFSAGGNPGWALAAGFKVLAADAGQGETDAGPSAGDAGEVEDGGPDDAGPTTSDAGPPDAGSAPDAGGQIDAGSMPDSGSIIPDAGKGDAGLVRNPVVRSSGCSSGPGESLLLGIAVAGLALRRRRHA